jgi:N-formylglutamate deformylase
LQLRSSEDAFVDRLIGDTLGAPVLKARFPRAYIDRNRAVDELDPAVIQGAQGAATNPRIAAGLGVIPRVVANGRAIQLGKMKLSEAQERIDDYYTPYHTALQGLIKAQLARFGACYLFDLHSMPRSCLPSSIGFKRPEIVIGDRYGTSSDHWLTDAVANIFQSAGFRVARNNPFAGGYITRHYGDPGHGVHAMQIEIDRSLYMNEAQITPRKDFALFKARFSAALTQMAMLAPAGQSLAAE